MGATFHENRDEQDSSKMSDQVDSKNEAPDVNDDKNEAPDVIDDTDGTTSSSSETGSLGGVDDSNAAEALQQVKSENLERRGLGQRAAKRWSEWRENRKSRVEESSKKPSQSTRKFPANETVAGETDGATSNCGANENLGANDDSNVAEASQEVKLGNLIALEPRLLSISIYRDPLEIPARPLGLKFCEYAGLGGVLVESLETSKDWKNHFMLPSDLPILPGDVVLSINGTKCDNLPFADVMEILNTSTGFMKLTFQKQIGVAQSDQDHAIAESIIVNPKSKSFPVGLDFETKDDGTLWIKSVASTSWLSSTCLEKGQILLSVQNKPCYNFSKEDVAVLLQDKLERSSIVSIKTYMPPEKRTSRLRRTVAAVGGGTLLGVGAVIMATPLHPVGHAMAMGGVGILGAEFEAPRKAMTRAKEAVNNIKNNRTASKTALTDTNQGGISE